jgi:hypothetical protein
MSGLEDAERASLIKYFFNSDADPTRPETADSRERAKTKAKAMTLRRKAKNDRRSKEARTARKEKKRMSQEEISNTFNTMIRKTSLKNPRRLQEQVARNAAKNHGPASALKVTPFICAALPMNDKYMFYLNLNSTSCILFHTYYSLGTVYRV